MPEKVKPLGVCDHCGGPIPDSQWYTTKRRPRLHCSIECKQTANSRTGAPVRAEKARRRVAGGEWQNPAKINPPDPVNIGRGVSRAWKGQVAAGTWRNPALTAEAREKLSRPRKHDGPLHSAIEKLKSGLKTADLTNDELAAYRAYRRELRAARREERNAVDRSGYHRRRAEMTDEEREAQRARWRAANAKRKG